ncbi:MAG: hypothetical protein H8E19_08415 [Deltaproteobacteria bacterium]|uniref:Uncharacterized protein n=1 Tax=Candidatus Desulfacyla euxinica TaxID=2841693 RepID=A0A8J6MZQ8_9DELT|nr:hypothetical protein [Candidatus Desulfacyla euxinica]
MKTEDREERFGIIAEKKGYISWPNLLEALEMQIEENTKKGEARFIGDILCDLKFLTKLQVRDVLESMEKVTAREE